MTSFRKVIILVLFIYLYIEKINGLVQVDLSQITINFQSSIKNYIPKCVAVDIEFFTLLSSSNSSSQSMNYLTQQSTDGYSISITNTSSFQISSPTDFISLAAILSMRCSASDAISDSFLVATQVNKQPDKNNVQQSITASSSLAANQWSITATVIRKCTGVNEYGFNCNEQCSNVDNEYSCYTCGNNGQRICCQSGDVNQDDCTYYNHPISTTLSPNLQCTSSAENTYFWLMISFAIVIGILIIILILVILELCFGVFTGHRTQKGSEDKDWIVQNEPRANHQLYDADINRTHQYRRRNEESSEDNSRRSPYVISREGVDNQTYDDESLRNQWVEPQPRRIARV